MVLLPKPDGLVRNAQRAAASKRPKHPRSLRDELKVRDSFIAYGVYGISANESDGTFGEQCDDLEDFEIFEQSLKNKLVF